VTGTSWVLRSGICWKYWRKTD